MIVGATVGSVLGFIFLIFILIGFLVVFKKRSYIEDDMANEIKWVIMATHESILENVVFGDRALLS